jgi:hypothetical protein
VFYHILVISVHALIVRVLVHTVLKADRPLLCSSFFLELSLTNIEILIAHSTTLHQLPYSVLRTTSSLSIATCPSEKAHRFSTKCTISVLQREINITEVVPITFDIIILLLIGLPLFSPLLSISQVWISAPLRLSLTSYLNPFTPLSSSIFLTPFLTISLSFILLLSNLFVESQLSRFIQNEF